MANIWENAVITNKGVELQAQILAGGNIPITAIRTGSGTVPVSQLNDQMELSNVKQTCLFQPIMVNGNTAIIPVILANAGLAEGYTLRQVGFYARDMDGEEILFALAQNSEPRYIPSEAEMPNYSLTWNFHFGLSNNVNLIIESDPAGLVTPKHLEERLNGIVFTMGPQSAGYPANPVENQVHIMYEG